MHKLDWWQATFPQGRQTLTITDASGHPVKIAYGEKGIGKPLVWCMESAVGAMVGVIT